MSSHSHRQIAESTLELNIYRHSLAVEACMGALYDYLLANGKTVSQLGEKADWLLAGLMHDIDYFGEHKATHPANTLKVLTSYGLSIDSGVHQIILDHDARQGAVHSLAGWAIRCVDSLTGLIVATALVYPTKKLADVKLASVMKRFLKEPKFAAGTRREEVRQCELATGLAIPLETFIATCLGAMQAIAPALGL